MITVLGESSSREELERRFVDQYAPFAIAQGWSLTRDQRVTTWTAPSGQFRIQVECVDHDYRDPRDVAGHFALAVQWSEQVLRLRDGVWTPVTVRLASAKKKAKLVTRRSR